MKMFQEANLPEGWKLAPIRYAFKTTEKPRGLRPANFETVPFIPMEAVPIVGCDVYPPEVRAGSAISSGTYCEDGDLLLAKITPSFENGKQAFASLNGDKFAYGTTEVIPLQAIPGEGVIEYLYSILLHPGLRASLAGKMEGSTGRQRLGKDVLLGTQVPLPPTDEQSQIARILMTVQRAIAQQQAIIATTRELKHSLMQKLFTEGLRGEPQQQTEIGLVPESWDMVPLGKYARIGNGSTPKRTNKEYWEGGHLPWLTSGKIHESIISNADEFVTVLAAKECHLPTVPMGSVLVAITGQGKTLGNAALVTFDTHISQHLAYIAIASDELYSPFIFRYLQSRYEYLRSIGRAGGSTKAALTCGFLKSMVVPKPDPTEQKEIAETFDILDEKLALAWRKYSHYSDIFKTLLHQLMTAQIRVHELDLDALGVPALD
jgi:type I restriction enzyme S subunit